MFNFKHGHRASPLGSPERRAYDAWRNLRRRCSSPKVPNFADYGGRGILFDPAWNDYRVFIEDMGLPPPHCSIERKDNNGPYQKENCIWAPREVQCNNKRNNRIIEFGGERKTLAQWARHLGLKPATILSRIDRDNWPLERALTPGKFHRHGKFTPVTLTLA
ncbi:MAG TPA: hypothetical protein VFX37_15130 [Pseudolabrys sp.]|nr:hypothetical protein [Pseudolabrys sp.]